jgi:hypothetical protein
VKNWRPHRGVSPGTNLRFDPFSRGPVVSGPWSPFPLSASQHVSVSAFPAAPPPVQDSKFDGSGLKVPYPALAQAFPGEILAAEERQFASVGHGTDFRYRSPHPSQPISASQLSGFQHVSLAGSALAHADEVIRMDEDLVYDGIGDEDFLNQAQTWKPDKHAPVRERAATRFQHLSNLPERRPKGGRRGSIRDGETGAVAAAAPRSDSERWEKVRKAFAKDARAMGDLEAITGTDWDPARRREKVAEYAGLSWQKLKARGLSNAKRGRLLTLLEAVPQ